MLELYALLNARARVHTNCVCIRGSRAAKNHFSRVAAPQFPVARARTACSRASAMSINGDELKAAANAAASQLQSQSSPSPPPPPPPSPSLPSPAVLSPSPSNARIRSAQSSPTNTARNSTISTKEPKDKTFIKCVLIGDKASAIFIFFPLSTWRFLSFQNVGKSTLIGAFMRGQKRVRLTDETDDDEKSDRSPFNEPSFDGGNGELSASSSPQSEPPSLASCERLVRAEGKLYTILVRKFCCFFVVLPSYDCNLAYANLLFLFACCRHKRRSRESSKALQRRRFVRNLLLDS